MDPTVNEAAQVVALLNQGLSQCVVAQQLNLSQSAASRVSCRFAETDVLTRRSSRRRCTSEREDHFIVTTNLRNLHRTGVDIQQQLLQSRVEPVSSRTVCRRLKEANLTPKRPAIGPKLTRRHRDARIDFVATK